MPCTQRVEPQHRVSASLASWRESAFSAGAGSRDSATDVAPHAQAAHAAVRENAQPHMRGRRSREQLASEEVSRISRQFGLAQQWLPSAAFDQVRWASARRVDHIDRAAIRKIAFEVIGVDFEGARYSARAESNQDPITAGSASAPCFPTAPHIL